MMHKLTVFGRVLVAFIGALAIVLMISILDLNSTRNLVTSYEQVEHSQKIINQLELVISLLKDAETGQRGYIISQNKVFLEPYSNALQRISKEILHLEKLLENENEQLRHLQVIRQLTDAKLNYMSRTIQLVELGKPEEAIALVKSGGGKQIMDQIRSIVNQMKNIENRVLNNFSLQVKKDYTMNIIIITVGIILTSLILTIGAYRLYHELNEQKKLRDNLIQTNIQLNDTVAELNRTNEELQVTNEELNAANEELNTANEMVLNYSNQLESTSQQLQVLNTGLEQTNKDLEAFSYSISHDLLSPMRSISGFAQILKEDYLPQFDAEGKRLINRIIVNSEKMSSLIHGLLEFSRVGKKGLEKTKFSMEKLILPLIEDAKESAGNRVIHFQVQPMPAVIAEPELIKQVWINLISNAVKFTSKKNMAYIEIGCHELSHEHLFYIKDNGAGFDMSYASKKLFGVFQRMHTKSEFEGTGVGLAIVQRIIQGHNGRIWAEAIPDQGATFYFTLPKQQL